MLNILYWLYIIFEYIIIIYYTDYNLQYYRITVSEYSIQITDAYKGHTCPIYAPYIPHIYPIDTP